MLTKKEDVIDVAKDKYTTHIQILPSGELEYKSIIAKPDDILELVLLDTKVQSLPGDASSIELENSDTLSGKNTITKGDFSLNELPKFAQEK
jgi:hypothetical protein